MIALFVVLLQFAVAKDIIEEDKLTNTFERTENGECVTYSETSSMKTKFSSDEMSVTMCDKAECSGTCVTTETKLSDDLKIETQDCPEYVGFTVHDKTKDCKYEKTGKRVYYKEGCFNEILKHTVKDNKLVTETYKDKGCTGDIVLTKEIGECGKCNTKVVIGDYTGTVFVQCGAISKMILVLLALVFFLF